MAIFFSPHLQGSLPLFFIYLFIHLFIHFFVCVVHMSFEFRYYGLCVTYIYLFIYLFLSFSVVVGETMSGDDNNSKQ